MIANLMAKARYRYNIMLRPEPEGGYTRLFPRCLAASLSDGGRS
jgi:hypothetical protein